MTIKLLDGNARESQADELFEADGSYAKRGSDANIRTGRTERS